MKVILSQLFQIEMARRGQIDEDLLSFVGLLEIL